MNPISHIDYLITTARILVDDPEKLRRAVSIGDDPDEKDKIRKAWRSIATKERFRIDSVELIARAQGLSVAEMFLMPGASTEWYKDSDIKYFGANVKQYREMEQLSKRELEYYAEIKRNTVWTYESRESMPCCVTMQKIADALDIEIADLFLPPDGIGKENDKNEKD